MGFLLLCVSTPLLSEVFAFTSIEFGSLVTLQFLNADAQNRMCDYRLHHIKVLDKPFNRDKINPSIFLCCMYAMLCCLDAKHAIFLLSLKCIFVKVL